jgi:pimeloyl-ACP methyl ester carboxylesterase
MSTHIDRSVFHQCYAKVDQAQRQSLYAFRTQHPPKHWEHDGVQWHYATLGRGDSTVLFLPGAVGSYYIWWQQLLALAENFKLISFDYPSLRSMEGLQFGLNAIFRKEGVERFHIVGSSMGGYVAQYLASAQPDRLLSATFANTFVPTMPLFRTTPFLRLAISVFPLKLTHTIYHLYSQHRLVPTGGQDALLEAYLLEFSHAGLGKRDFLARLSCVTQTFTPLPVDDQTFPILLIDSENDPLIRPTIRQAVRNMYPRAQRYTFQNAGHFCYLNQPETYTGILRTFLLEGKIPDLKVESRST